MSQKVTCVCVCGVCVCVCVWVCFPLTRLVAVPASELQPCMDHRLFELMDSRDEQQLPVFFEIENAEWK